MTGRLRVQWTLTPANPPVPWRHCATCGAIRAFFSSGKVRLNANGRRLDAWLIYRCATCDRTWNRTLLERRAVQHIQPAELEAMERSARDWVRRHEFDIVALKREATDITQDEDALVTKPARRQTAGTPEMVEVTLVVSSVTGLRLDRLLSRELCISRTRLQSADKAGGLLVCPPAKAALRRMIGTSITITLLSRAFTEAEFLRICDAVFAR